VVLAVADIPSDPHPALSTTPPYLEAVSRIVLNWGSADHTLGLSLEAVYRIQDREAAADLLQALDLRKKVDLLWKRRNRLQSHPEIEKIVKEIKKICENEKRLRDTLSHGIALVGLGGENIFYSEKSFKFVSEHDLERAILISLQLRALSKRLWIRAYGAEPDEAYPQIPTEQ